MFNITQEELTQLSKIYNTLSLISTKGEDTLVMADCLRALEQTLKQIIENNQNIASQQEAIGEE